jgi:hypothetical protein
MGWGMWHAWEINVYIVWWEHLKQRVYLGKLCVDRQIILKLICRTKGYGLVVEGFSGLDTSGKNGVAVNTRHSQYQYYVQVNN